MGSILDASSASPRIEEEDSVTFALSRTRRPVTAVPVVDETWEPSAYRCSPRSRAPSAIATLVVVLSLLATFTYMNIAAPPVAKRTTLRVVSLPLESVPPPRPIAQRPRPLAPAPVQPQITAPPPIAQVQAPPQTIVATAPLPPHPVPIPAPVAAAAPAPAAPASPPAVADGGDLSSKMIFAKPPSYPLESRRRHEEGTVVLSLLVSTDGTVADISVAQSSGFKALDQAALAAVRKWRWAPRLIGGQAVMVRGQVSSTFGLKR